MTGRSSHLRPGRALGAALLALALASCVDGAGPTGGGSAVPLDLAPRFQVDPDLFPSAPIDRIRLRAFATATLETVGTADLEVDPGAERWELPLVVDLGDANELEILVEVELLAGSSVEWSGRLGPIAVSRGATPQVRTVEIHRGPLENLEVLTIDIAGAPLQLEVGASATLTAQLTLAQGSTASPVVYWATTNAAVATVSASGTTATLTAVAPGAVDVIATAGAATDQVSVVVVEPPEYDVEWRGTTTDWLEAANWSTGQVPSAGDDVYIAVSTAYPQLVADVEVGSLGIAEGASITLLDAVLTVNGDLDAAGTIDGGGSVVLAGSDVTVRGGLDAYLDVSGTATASGPVSALGMFIAGSGARFDVGGQTVDLAGPLNTTQGGTLAMAGGSLSVVDATFDGGGTEGMLTGGTLRVTGNFSAGSDPLAFAATGSHTVVFRGAQAQRLDLAAAAPDGQRFANVTFDNPSGVNVTGGLVATGTVQVSQGAVDAGEGSLYVGAGLVDPDGGLAYGELVLIGDVSALPTTLSWPVRVASGASVDWPVDGAVIEGDLRVEGSLDLGAHTLDACCSVQVAGSLTVPAGGSLTIGTGLLLEPGSTLHVDGAVSTPECFADPAATITGTNPPAGCGGLPAGTRTWVGPASGDWSTAVNWSPAAVPTLADDVVIPAGASVLLSQDAQAGSLSVGDGSYVFLDGHVLEVSGDVAQTSGAGGVVNGILRITGPGSLLQGNLPDVQLRARRTLTAGTTVNFTGLQIEDADLDLGSATVIVSGDFTVTGDQAHLVMTTTAPAPTLHVLGTASFDGGEHTGLLTSGTIFAYGDFVVGSASPTGFVADLGHTLTLTGTSDQLVSFGLPGPTQQRVGQLTVTNVATVTFASPPYVSGDGVLSGWSVVPAGATLSFAGDLTLTFGSILQAEGTVEAAACFADDAVVLGSDTPCGSPSPVTKVWAGGAPGAEDAWDEPANWVPAGPPQSTDYVLVPSRAYAPIMSADQRVSALLAYGVLDQAGYTLTVDGDAAAYGTVDGGLVDVAGSGSLLAGNFEAVRISQPRALSGSLLLAGDLEVLAPLTVGPNGINTGGLLVEGPAAVLEMTDAAAAVAVRDDAVFEGAGHSDVLTAGTLSLQGDLTVAGTYAADAFSSSGTVTQFLGTEVQTVTLSDPQVQTFYDVVVFKSGATLQLADTMIVVGNLDTQLAVFGAPVAGPVLEVHGRVSATDVTFAGVPLRIVSPVGGPTTPGDHSLNRLTFTAMPADVVQLYLSMSGSATPLALASPVFQSMPDPRFGGYYIQTVNVAPTNGTLIVDVGNPTPATASGLTLTDQFSVINWPYIP